MSAIKVRYELVKDAYHIVGDTLTGRLDTYLSDSEAAELVLSLVKQGLEVELPQSQNYVTGKLEATEAHLSDMRRLVFMENEKGEV